MFRRKIAGSCALVLSLLAGCAHNSSSPAATSASVSLTLPQDDLGRQINLASPPRRIVSLAPGVTETIFALGEGSRLVGRDQMSNFPAAAAKIPQAADFNGPFFEKVAALRPDFIIAQGETLDRARIELWQRKCGAPVALLNANTIDGVEKGIGKIAAWLGVSDKARQVADFPSPMATNQRTTAFFEVGRSPLWTAGNDTLVGQLMAYCALNNVAAIRGYKEFNIESLLKADPDVYIVTAAQPDRARTLQELRRAPRLKNLRCIKEGRVAVLHADWVMRPGPRLKDGLREMRDQWLRAGAAKH